MIRMRNCESGAELDNVEFGAHGDDLVNILEPFGASFRVIIDLVGIFINDA